MCGDRGAGDHGDLPARQCIRDQRPQACERPTAYMDAIAATRVAHGQQHADRRGGNLAGDLGGAQARGVHLARDFVVRLAPPSQQALDLALPIAHVQQGAIARRLEAAHELVRAAVQAKDRPAGHHAAAVLGIDQCPASGGDDEALSRAQFAAQLGFQRAERRLALLGEYGRDRLARAGLDLGVHIHKRATEQAGYLASDAGLARAHEPRDHDVDIRWWTSLHRQSCK